ncbi:tyrosine-type recombinase/integrase [Kocuria sp. KH4]
MPRPRLQVGTLGEISYTPLAHRKVRARARYRDTAGRTRYLEATGTSQSAARQALQERLDAKMSAATGEGLTPDSTVQDLATAWLQEVHDSERRPQTVEAYRQNINAMIVPGLGELVLWECTTGRLDRWLKATAKVNQSAAKRARVVLGMMFALAARHDAVGQNPVADTRLPATKTTAPQALTPEQVARLRTGVWQYVTDPQQNGQKRSRDLPDVVDVLLGTGARISEALALRWEDVDLAASPVRVTISGTVVPLQGGVVRQPAPKTSSGYRSVAVPAFTAEVLLRRSVDSWSDLVFPSDVGTLRWPNNFHRMWRDARSSEYLRGFEWVTMRVLRKTVATTITRAMDDEHAAAVLGHASTAVTHRHYIERAAVAPDVSGVLQSLGQGDAS